MLGSPCAGGSRCAQWPGYQRLAVALPQHPDEHRPKRPILLAVDKQFGEGTCLGFPQYEPMASARSKSGSIRTWRSSPRGAGAERLETLP